MDRKNKRLAWVYLFIAGISEIGWAFGLKFSNGFTRLIPSIITIVLIIVSFWIFSQAMRDISMGTAYAVFTGIGAVGTVLIGILFLNEDGGVLKLFFLTLLFGGIIGLVMSSSDEQETKVKGKC
ncbi:multidrug efflux SMR transporter [Bacillus aquiflavi]|uniref:Multidrug efflux SMR transporter n=1 Tax=Bacillus aquiflavi TaxID=2672567 RepID=A0A6B3VY40_9BACI|nr:multidrug efflux SMR transporter [Bacillus aquiflavi]MBA4536860.1 multidrug efflux SMR transporter [Bacillus aquiflavi]NEY81227.1 multidrug efflux SMR transporter [Bacillus aquiflavi]UAC48465.1 multidrug efflux SMR transporter [Bacillus aquiflavi]